MEAEIVDQIDTWEKNEKVFQCIIWSTKWNWHITRNILRDEDVSKDCVKRDNDVIDMSCVTRIYCVILTPLYENLIIHNRIERSRYNLKHDNLILNAYSDIKCGTIMRGSNATER